MSRRSLFAGTAALFASGFAAKWLVDELPSPGTDPVGGKLPPPGPDFIDVRELKKTMTVEELNRTAEQYFASAKSWDDFLAKPLAQVADTPALLNNVSHLVRGLDLLPGMTVMDFGAGSCWLSRWLTQLGMEVIALDVSETALKIGQELYRRLPIIGNRPAPRFMHFDGHRIELADASVDRILVLDTLHHVLNQDEVLREMARILKAGGIAGFSEPGPNHSRSPGAQFEMRTFRVLEDDIDIHRIWALARQAGFQRIGLAVVSSRPYLLTLGEFDDYLEGGRRNEEFAYVTRAEMLQRRMFFLHRTAQSPTRDSRGRIGLNAQLQVKLAATTVKAGLGLTAKAVVTNSGRATWLPHSAKRGAVWLGAHLLDGSGRMLDANLLRQTLTSGDGRPVAPGETVTLDVRIPALSRGTYILEFDLVSDAAGWFAQLGSEPVRVEVQVM